MVCKIVEPLKTAKNCLILVLGGTNSSFAIIRNFQYQFQFQFCSKKWKNCNYTELLNTTWGRPLDPGGSNNDDGQGGGDDGGSNGGDGDCSPDGGDDGPSGNDPADNDPP